MKNIIAALVVALTFSATAFGGECNGSHCHKTPRRVVTVTKKVVTSAVAIPRKVVNGVRSLRPVNRLYR